MKLYRAIDVWKKTGDGRLLRYRCFEVLPEGRYCVQSADFYDVPMPEERVRQHERQFFELLSETPPDERSETYETLDMAIQMHDSDFDED
jgi:hypothetical protein